MIRERLRCWFLAGHDRRPLGSSRCQRCGLCIKRFYPNDLEEWASEVVRGLGFDVTWFSDDRGIGIGNSLLSPWLTEPVWRRPWIVLRWLVRTEWRAAKEWAFE